MERIELIIEFSKLFWQHKEEGYILLNKYFDYAENRYQKKNLFNRTAECFSLKNRYETDCKLARFAKKTHDKIRIEKANAKMEESRRKFLEKESTYVGEIRKLRKIDREDASHDLERSVAAMVEINDLAFLDSNLDVRAAGLRKISDSIPLLKAPYLVAFLSDFSCMSDFEIKCHMDRVREHWMANTINGVRPPSAPQSECSNNTPATKKRGAPKRNNDAEDDKISARWRDARAVKGITVEQFLNENPDIKKKFLRGQFMMLLDRVRHRNKKNIEQSREMAKKTKSTK